MAGSTLVITERDHTIVREVARFGAEKLRVIKDLDPQTLDVIVPSMMLQPIVENAIKHGLAPKIEGGSIVVRSRLPPEHR